MITEKQIKKLNFKTVVIKDSVYEEQYNRPYKISSLKLRRKLYLVYDYENQVCTLERYKRDSIVETLTIDNLQLLEILIRLIKK